uniref:G_PROTEIN_RECEP_F1_2 domain-containing protein n=1 Tax=Steinernema glaseri TaxID=37863 RepID=A0A1I7YSN1_9BILA
MNQPASALCILSIAILNSVFNPFFRRTRKGLFIVHWAIINYVTACKGHSDLVNNPGDVALLSASFFVLLEHISTRHCSGREISSTERSMFILFLSVSDIISYVLPVDIRSFIRVLLAFCTLFASVKLSVAPLKNPYNLSHQEMEDIKHDDLFYAWNDPLSCFGRLGRFTLAAIVMNSMVQIYPVLLRMPSVLYVIYVLRTVAPLGLLFAPGFFAGTVQSAKSIGRLVGELKTMKMAKLKDVDDAETSEMPEGRKSTIIKFV